MLIKHRGSLGQDLIGNFWIKVEKYTRELGGGGGAFSQNDFKTHPPFRFSTWPGATATCQTFLYGG